MKNAILKLIEGQKAANRVGYLKLVIKRVCIYCCTDTMIIDTANELKSQYLGKLERVMGGG